MGRRNIFVVLDRSEIATLQHYMHKMLAERKFRARKRAQSVWLSNKNKKVAEIAKHLNCSEKSVYTWLKNYSKSGIGAIREPQRKNKLTGEQIRELVRVSGWAAVLSKGKSKVFQNRWSFKKISDWVKEKWGITLSPEHIRRLIMKNIRGK